MKKVTTLVFALAVLIDIRHYRRTGFRANCRRLPTNWLYLPVLLQG